MGQLIERARGEGDEGMNRQDAEVIAIVQKLKERARAHPWVSMGVPPREYYHRFANGLSICFTLDILPGIRYWHLSIARVPGGATPEEIEFWRQAFFNEEPDIELPAQLPGVSSSYWGA